MIKEYSVDFNENKMSFKSYNNYVGDLSQPFRTVTYERNVKDQDQHIKEFIKEFKRQIKIYESNIQKRRKDAKRLEKLLLLDYSNNIYDK